MPKVSVVEMPGIEPGSAKFRSSFLHVRGQEIHRSVALRQPLTPWGSRRLHHSVFPESQQSFPLSAHVLITPPGILELLPRRTASRSDADGKRGAVVVGN